MTDRRQLLQDALTTIERLEAKLAENEEARRTPLAIVGAGCRYPGGAEDPEGLWRIARDGVDAVSEVPADRFDAAAFQSPDPRNPGKMVMARGGFLSQVERFDPLFFGISPREAASLDPQQRLLLETAYEALESAAIPADKLSGTASGVFVGITTNDYAQLLRASGVGNLDVYSATGIALNSASGRISFTHGLQGPCLSVDAACASSLVTVHLACQSLRTGESDLALAGGVNVILQPDAMALFSKWGMMAPDGRCKTFDASADGFVRAEGCAVIALKRLADAVAAGDPILAVIRGSAVNCDGRSSGLTVPNGPAQQKVIRSALASAGLEPGDLDYVEAHGTGTSLGDPIEAEALGAVMSGARPPGRPLLVGSVKTNIGHAEAASGLAGLLKVVMALRHETIPASLHFKRPNPAIPWAELPLSVPTVATPWRRGDRPRRAGVSAFGFSGTNAHVILEESPPPAARAAGAEPPGVVPLSARDEGALRVIALRTADYLVANPDATLTDLARTAATGRAHLTRRVAVVAESRDGLERDLREIAAGSTPAAAVQGTARVGERPRTAFLFTGQGAQYAGMGRGLYGTEPVFRAALDRAAAILDPLLPRRLLDVLFPEKGQPTPLGETRFTQPALVALEVSLAELWRSWGVTPSVVLGHSVGEYAAACVAGVLSLEDALALIAERGRLMQALPSGGGMAAIFEPEDRVVARIAPFGVRLAVAAVNGPEETVISGDGDAVAQVLAGCEREAVKGRALEVSHAFHSHRLDPMLDALERRASAVTHELPRIPLVSNLTGQPFAPGARPDGAYWRRHAREPVRFAACVEALRAAGVTALVEVGPHPTLLALAARAAPDARWTSAASLRRGRDDRKELLASLAALYAGGAAISWDTYWAGRGGRRVAMPTYPFERARHWFTTAPAATAARATPRGEHPLLGSRQLAPAPGAQFFAQVGGGAFAGDATPGATLLPRAAGLEVALAAARSLDARGPLTLEAITLDEPLPLGAPEARPLHVAVDAEVAGRAALAVRSALAIAGAPWRVHVRATISRVGEPGAPGLAVADVRARCSDADVAALYARLGRAGLAYASGARALKALQLGQAEAVGTLEVAADETPWVLHPALLDGACLVAGALLAPVGSGDLDRVLVPSGVEVMRVSVPRAPRKLNVVARLRPAAPGAGRPVADLRLESEAGDEIASITGLALEPLDVAALQREAGAQGVIPRAFGLRWEKARTAESPQALDGKRVVLVDDAAGTARALADLLRARGARCQVLAAAEVGDLTDGALRTLVGEVEGARLAWLVDCSGLDPADAEDPAATLRPSYLRLLRLAQGLVAAAPAAGLCVVTRGALAAADGDRPSPARAALLGLARTVAAERGDVPTLRVDLDPATPPDPAALLSVLTGAERSEPEVALRQGQLRAPRLEELLPDRGDGPPPVRRDGTYLVTGGLGGVGLATAEWLARRGAGELVLVGRRGGARAEDAPALERLRALGARVTVAACDVADPDAVAALWRDVLAARPPLRGIIHAAGVVADATLADQDASRFDAVATSKVAGTLRLHAASARDPLDFFVLYSSTSGLFGNAGQAPYGAANAFLDGFAAWRRARGLVATSAAWGAWAGVGMAASVPEAHRARWARFGVGFLDPQSAFAHLGRAASAGLPYVAVACLDPALAAQGGPWLHALLGRGAGAKAPEPTAADGGPLAALSAATDPAARAALLRRYVIGEAARVLGLDAATLDLDASLSSFGFDSLMAVQLRNRIESDLSVKLPLAGLIAGPSLARVAEDIGQRLGSAPPSAAAATAAPARDAGGFEEGSL